MTEDTPSVGLPTAREGDLLMLASLGLVVGIGAGLISAAFRLCLEYADHLRGVVIATAHYWPLPGFVAVVAFCGAATATATWMVRRFAPQASGSGIPHVEAVLRNLAPTGPYTVIPVKFVGGLLAIGSGLALGREGPSVQMGASIAVFVGHAFRRGFADRRVLMAAGAGAGLATAFNAPIAGAIFVLEELVQRFEHRIAMAALAASFSAIAVAQALLGRAPVFDVPAFDYANGTTRVAFFILGAFAGLAAVGYNAAILGCMAGVDRLQPRIRIEAQAAIIGAAVGAVAWFAPGLVGGGDPITQSVLSGTAIVALVPLALLARVALGTFSYAANTPGGLFAPMLTVGAQGGLLFGVVCHTFIPGLNVQPEGFALVGMAAFFTGIVRSPLTGIVLVTEMTGNVTLLLPMLGACCTAMIVPILLRNPPIYDSLRENMMRRQRLPAHSEAD
jgi:chloride channel protein, CIC family